MDVKASDYKVAWSEVDQEFVATVAEFPSLSWLDTEQSKAQTGLLSLVAEVVADMEASGEQIPDPLGSHK